MLYRRTLTIAACAAALLACNLGAVAAPPVATSVVIPTATSGVTAIQPSQPAPPTLEAVSTPTTTPTTEPTLTSAPVGSLKGTVQERANCRYGPGPYYLYKIGLLAGAPVDVVGRTIDGGWIYVQYVGTKNLCWVNSKLVQVAGDIMSLKDYYPEKAPLPRNSKFGPASILSVSGGGGSVTVEWSPVVLPAVAVPSDGEMPYVIEIWTCRNGAPGFYTVGTEDTSMTFEVDDSCGQPSHANLVAQNKLGVSSIAPIALP
jgi:hypothetical protein